MAQGGNGWEWEETSYDLMNSSGSSARAFRGGVWFADSSPMRATFRGQLAPPNDMSAIIGLRVASLPESSSDFNGDGNIDAADYVAWRKGLAAGAYTQVDYITWRQNFGTTTTGAAADAQSLVQHSVP
jgi:hypothetical protein